MQTGAQIVAFIATARPDVALAFYRDVLGLSFVEETPFAIVLESGATTVRIQKVRGSLTPQPFTALGWEVPDLRSEVGALRERGVAFERYDGFGQDAAGVWTTPDGALVAWFKDPDGNLLSLSQPPPT